jgi:RHS repeat-associated protein
MPGAVIALDWSNVGQAAEYQVYRKGPTDADFAPLVRVVESQHQDLTPADGLYAYRVTSIRHANGQEAESEPSPLAQATSDGTVPNPPGNLAATLASNGIQLTWGPPTPYTEPITYRIYRAAGLELVDITGMAPLVKELTQTLVVDPTPSLTDHAYVVAAEDNVGNVSAPSNSVYLNPGLLPVSSLTLVHDVGAGQKPRLTWTHPSASIASYDVWVESAEVASTTHPTSTWLHAAYASGAATYAVEAVDNGGQESLPRALRLVPITVAPAPGALIVRGHIAPVDFDVTCAEDVPSAVLRIKVAGREHVSAPFAATAGTPKRVSVVIGGYPELGASALAEITSRREPAAGERVDVVEKVPVGTRSDAYVAQVTDLDLERGAIGSARFAFSNPGPLPVEIVMAQASGNAASNQVRLALVDGDGNVLSTAAVQQSGAGTVALSNGTVVARVAPGATFVSDAMPLPVPGNAPDNIAVRLTIDEVHYDLGKPTAVKIPGLSVQAPGTLIEPPYAAVVSDAVPEYSFGDQPIEITGSAHYSGGGAPAPNVPVTLVIRLQGFERKIGLYTDAAGSFSHTFTPGPNEGGVYDVWAKYPELLTQPAQDHFSIQRVSFSPTQPKLTLAAGFESQLSIGVATTQGTGLTNLRLEVGTLPSGVTVTPASPQTWTTQTTGFVSATVVATAAAPAQSTFLLTLRSDERVWGTIPVQYTATTAKAQLVSAPTFVETGAVKGGLQMEEIVISNKGLAAAQNVTLELLNANKTAPAPGWASIASTKELPNIAAGATVPVLLAFAPAESTVLSAASPYGFWLRASSGGATVLEVPVYAWVSASGEGTALFKVIDMYTGSTVENTGVVGAKIKLDRLLGEPLSLTVTTGAGGEVLLEEVPAGNYRWRATATDHEAVEGNLAVKPGVTSIQTVFLPSPYITIEWDVTETTIEDSYEVVLSATFETDVPAPVVVVEPASISMPAMDPGEVFLGEFTIRNYGLIKAQSSTFKLPDGGADYKFELLASVPDELAAGQTLVVPYRVTKLDGNSSSGNSSGGGCCGANAYWGGFSYGWYCLAGEWVWGAFPIVYLRVDSSCSTGKTGPITIPTPPYNPTSSSSSSGCSGPCGWKTPEWKSQSTKDKPCDPCEHPSLTPIEKECCHTGKGQPTNSEVDLVTGEYRDSVEDLPIQVLGWRVPFIRSYAKGKWNIELQNGDLQFNEVNGELASIQYDGVLFSKTGASNAVFEAGDGIALFASSAPAAAWELHGSSSSVFYFDAAGKLLRLENARGHQISLGRDANGRVSTMADTFGSVFATFAYNPDGTVASITAADGRSVQYAWANGNLSQVVDPAGGVTEYQYDAKGQITRKRKPNGAVDNLTYSTSGMVVSQLDDEGNGFYFDYGVNEATKQFYSAVTFTDGRLVERWFNEQGTLLVTLVDGAEQGELSDGAQVKVDPKGNITGTEAADGTLLDSTEYDSQGRVKRQTNSRGYVTEFVYDANGNTASETVRDGKSGPVVAQSLYSHDAHGRVVENIQVGLGGAPDAVTTYEYDNANNIVHETSSDGAEVFRTFDARGLQLSELDAQGNLVEWEYDALGRLVQRRLTNGSTGAMATEQWAFAPDVDETGKVIGERVVFTDADQRQTIERFDTRGRPVEIIDAWGRATRTTYDSQGDLVRLVTAEGDVTEFVRETLPSGLRRTTRKFNGEVASIEELDKFDRVVRRAVGSDEVTFIYDGSYPKPAEEVRPGVRLLYKYDYFGNRTEVITRFDDGEEVVETFAFDGMRQTSHTNALGQTFSEQFDDSDQLTQAMLPSGRTATTARDGLGRAVEHRSHSGDAALALAYDDGFQVSQRTLPNGTTLQYTYDAAGQITGLQTSFGLRIDLDVDRLGNPVEKRWFSSATDQTPDEVAQFEYDSVGQRTLSQNPTVSVETERDYFARTTTTTYDFGPFSKSFTVRHDSLGRTTALIMPDGDAYGFVYDGHGRLDGVHLPGSSSIDIAYPNSLTVERTYPNGVVFTDSRNPVLAPASVQAFDSQGTALMDWQYDMDAFRVAGITTEAGNYSFTYDADGQVLTATYPELSPDAFTYDADGNRLTAQATGSAAWSYSAADELLSIGALRSFTWNDAGDLASRADTGGTTTYEYDAAGRLHIVRAPSGAVVAEYRYDADGLRVVKKVGTTTTYAIYGEQGLLAEYDSTGAELRRYVWAPKAGAWQRELLVFEAAGERHFPLLDAGGEVQKLTNAAGAVSFDISLRVFGEGVVDAQSTVSFPLRPSGQYHDAETGLHYNLFRYYDPELGRYLSVDPLLEVGGNRNLYVFAFNNPVEYVDLMGLAAGYDGGDCMVNFKASLDFKDAACSVKFKINPLVSVKVKISVKPNRQDCCKNGVLIKQGKGCIEVKGSISGEVGVNPASYPGIDAIAKAAGIKLDIKAVTISASLGCNFCSKCGESGYGANFDKCCADLEVEGPSFSFSWKAFKISLKTGKVTIGKVCIGPYGWSLSGPSGEGPSGGGGGKW